MKLKYVIVNSLGPEAPIVFNADLIQHCEVWRWEEAIVSAGFCCYDADTGWRCWGKSVSTGRASRPEIDAAILNRMLFR